MSASPDPDPRRRLPGVDVLLADERVAAWVEARGREPVARALRGALEDRRRRLSAGGEPLSSEALRAAVLDDAEARLEAAFRPSLRPVLNATGVVLHTNLGRAPLAEEAVAALGVASGYANLEYDLERGARGSRYGHCAELLCELSGAEAALVVNNNAAAVSLIVNELALGRDVIVSRGELVEIGGSFRMPEVVIRSGARLLEVGTTNRTRLEDYARAIGPETGALLKVHPSNYRMEGFVASVDAAELAALGRREGVPVAYDLGSGLLRPELLAHLPAEPGVPEAVASGVDLVTWSGDKLLGGPQAGVILGREETVERLRRNPLLRAFRVDKLTLAALEATLRLYRDPETAAERIPVLGMLRASVDSVERRAKEALRGLEDLEARESIRLEVVATEALVGGGSLPAARLPSAGWAVTGVNADELQARCREGRPPLIGRVEDGGFLLDFRTLLPGQEAEVARVLRRALAEVGG